MEVEMTNPNIINITKWVKRLEGYLKLNIDDFPLAQNFIRLGQFRLTHNKRTLWDVEVQPHLTDIYSRYQNGVYILTFNNYIVKIGGTKVGMRGRITSYLCGHCIPERKKKNGEYYPGKMSVTNAYIYNTIYQYLLDGKGEFFLYFYPIEDIEVTKDVFGQQCVFKVQSYDEYEKIALLKYREMVGEFPILSDNCHP